MSGSFPTTIHRAMELMGLEWMFLSFFIGTLLRILRLFSYTEKPSLYYKTKNDFIQSMLDSCPIFTSIFKPTLLWGKSGHLQTMVHALMGRVKPRWPDSFRYYFELEDGATMSYDLFLPPEDSKNNEFTLAICPGLANSSECIYLRAFSEYATSHGYRVAMLNHLGALKSEPLTSPRTFTYGGTEEYSHMVEHLKELFPGTKIIVVGFSMGGNIVTKYLGENLDHQRDILCGLSVCQGYEINKCKEQLMQWGNCRRIYTYLMTLNIRRLLSRHRATLFSEEGSIKYGFKKEDKVFKATSLYDIDDNYTCCLAGCKSADEYYHAESSAYFLNNIRIPMLFLNALDDPLVPECLLEYPKQLIEKNENCIVMTTRHGGHLGFFEGGIFVPDNITWLDRFILEFADGVIGMYRHGNHPSQVTTTTDIAKEDSPLFNLVGSLE
ncbi:monoacylglycerol lipase ABHD2-like isoform X2 [Dreissena polymorpha]|uniref:monoacylglycerol lipase ABHD2-like isoform X2 n=1 Tax=Dreissena polymorpha TaxID=45954 RepID=UPI0022642EA1|nr:monoacylglycerol lipase ABHD2-like isoform X2 [Dreissena polymorpha]